MNPRKWYRTKKEASSCLSCGSPVTAYFSKQNNPFEKQWTSGICVCTLVELDALFKEIYSDSIAEQIEDFSFVQRRGV